MCFSLALHIILKARLKVLVYTLLSHIRRLDAEMVQNPSNQQHLQLGAIDRQIHMPFQQQCKFHSDNHGISGCLQKGETIMTTESYSRRFPSILEAFYWISYQHHNLAKYDDKRGSLRVFQLMWLMEVRITKSFML